MSVVGYEIPHLRRTAVSISNLPGSCMFVSSILQPEQTDFCKDVGVSCSALNVACCFVLYKSERISVASVYRSQSTCTTTALEGLNNVILALSDHAKHLIFVGDFNMNLLDNCT